MASRCPWLEYSFIPNEYQILEEPIKFEKGYVKAIDKPRLRVEINQKMFDDNIIS